MYRRSPADLFPCLIICIFRIFVKQKPLSYFSEKVAHAVSLQSQAPQPLIST